MKAEACARLVQARLTSSDIVVCGLGGTEAAMKAVGEAAPTYYASDPMGIWPSVALGLAMARPDARVVFLAGDGDLAMNLQSLITIASVAPRNLRIILFQNGRYASAGGQPLGGADRLSFSGVAAACGFVWAREVADDTAVAAALDEVLAQDQLAFLSVRLEDTGAPHTPPGPWSQVEVKAFFMQQLGHGREEGAG